MSIDAADLTRCPREVVFKDLSFLHHQSRATLFVGSVFVRSYMPFVKEASSSQRQRISSSCNSLASEPKRRRGTAGACINPGDEVARGPGISNGCFTNWQTLPERCGVPKGDHHCVFASCSWDSGLNADRTLHQPATVRLLRQEPNAVESGWTYYFERLGPPLFNVDAVRLNADARLGISSPSKLQL